MTAELEVKKTLGCLGGKAPPAELVEDLRVVSRLPAEAQRELFHVLGPALSEVTPPGLERAVEAFAKRFELDANALARGLRGCRVLLTSAAALDVGAPAFKADLDALDPSGGLERALAPGFDAAIDLLQKEIARAALFGHGNVVEGVDWRVDRITESKRGDKIILTIAVLTLAYRDGEKKERITLQLTRDSLRELRAMCDRLLR